jgi:hypothetical protein
MSVIQAGNTTSTSLIYTGDTTGNLVFTTGGANTVALTVDNVQSANFVNPIKVGGNQAINGPAFSAYLSATQSFTANAWTKIQCNTEEFDTNNNYDNATNYRFTPTVAGYYQVSGAFTNASILAQVGLSLYKNGSAYKRLYNGVGGGNTSSGVGSCLVYLNGSTDYIELYGLTTSTQNAYADSGSTYFQACLVRGA